MTSKVSRTLLSLLLISGLALVLSPTASVRANPVSYTLYGATEGWGFSATTITSPGPELTALPGETVSVTLYSVDVRHNFYVDYNGNQLPDLDEPISPDFRPTTGPITYDFTATTTPGTYTYYCDYHSNTQFGGFTVGFPLTVDFTVTPSVIFKTEPVMFTAVVSGGTTPYTYSWDALADGIVDGTGSTLTFAFPSKGPRSVQLTVTDQAGASVTVLKTFIVRLEPKFAALKWDDGQKAFFTKFKVPANFDPPLTSTITVTIDIFDASTGTRIATIADTFTDVPQRTAMIVFIPWTAEQGFTPGSYTFTGELTYQTLDASGVDGSRTGSFVAT